MTSEGRTALALADGTNLPGVYPPGTRWDIEIPTIDLPHFIDESFVKFADRPAIDFLGKKMSYRKLGQLIGSATKGLQERGVKPGMKIGLYMPNSPYYPIMFFAALKAGATVVHYFALDTEEERRKQIEDNHTDIMVTVDLKKFHDGVEKLREQKVIGSVIRCAFADMLPQPLSLVFKGAKHKEIAPKIALQSAATGFYTDFAELTRNDGFFESVPLRPEDTAVLQYTGGTTGVSKGVMLSHFNLVANICQVEEFLCASARKDSNPAYFRPGQDSVLASPPYSHAFASMAAMLAIMKMGGELQIIPDPRDIKQTLKTIDKKRPKLMLALPQMLQAMARHPDVKKYDLSSLETIISGGSALLPSIVESFESATKVQGKILQGFGMSEASPVVSCNLPGGGRDNETVGKPCPRTEVKIVDIADSSDIKHIGEVGRILVRGPQVMTGYFNRPDETAKVLSADGWLDTGDAGYLTPSLDLRITGRLKRMSTVNSHNVFHSQIEEAIARHPAVAEAIVIGVPDVRSGEATKAFVCFKKDAVRPTQAEMDIFLSQSLNKLEIPKFMEVRDELPRTKVGKPDHTVLEKEELAKRAMPPPAAPQP